MIVSNELGANLTSCARKRTVMIIASLLRWFSVNLARATALLDYKIARAHMERVHEFRVHTNRHGFQTLLVTVYSCFDGRLIRIGTREGHVSVRDRQELEYLYELYLEKGKELSAYEVEQSLNHHRNEKKRVP